MFTSLVVALALAAGTAACSQEKAAAVATADAKAPKDKVVNGVRHLAIEVLDTGYKPTKLKAKPGEPLVLEFTRKTESACAKQIKIAGGTPVDLPLNQVKEFPVTMPATGDLAFTCGMDMMSGVIVPAS